MTASSKVSKAPSVSKRSIFFLMALFALSAAIFAAPPPAAFAAAWDGTTKDASWYKDNQTVFTLTKPAQLAGLAELVNGGNNFSGKTVKLGSDIDLGNKQWTPIGFSETYSDYSFAGIFDGCGYKITRLNINKKPSKNYQNFGLFGHAYLIRNLSVNGAVVVEQSDMNYTNACVGGIVGFVSDGHSYDVSNGVYNCAFEGIVKNDNQHSGDSNNRLGTGGIAGIANRLIACTTSVDVTGRYALGGIVGGSLGGGFISNCTSSGTISGFGESGGIAGNYRGSISNCISSCTVDGNGGFGLGGIVYRTDSGYRIINCVSNGSVSGYLQVAGITDTAEEVINCVSNGNVSGGVNISGITSGSNSNCTSCGDIIIKTKGGHDSYGSGGGIMSGSVGTHSYKVKFSSATGNIDVRRTLESEIFTVGALIGNYGNPTSEAILSSCGWLKKHEYPAIGRIENGSLTSSDLRAYDSIADMPTTSVLPSKVLTTVAPGGTVTITADTYPVGSNSAGILYKWELLDAGASIAGSTVGKSVKVLAGQIPSIVRLKLTATRYYPKWDNPLESECVINIGKGGDTPPIVTGEKYPIIFIPGVMGSNLYSEPNAITGFKARVWLMLKDLKDKFPIGSRIDIIKHPSLDVRPSLQDQRSLSVWDPDNEDYGDIDIPLLAREYGAGGTAKAIIDRLCNEFAPDKGDRPIYFFSYDWRQSNEVSAAKLYELITQLTSGANAPSKVDLVCHSMGGIVASTYFKNHDRNKIGKVITAGTPYEGSPKVYHVATQGIINTASQRQLKELFDKFYTGLAILGVVTTETKTKFPALVELLPTENYFETGLVQTSTYELTPVITSSGTIYTRTGHSLPRFLRHSEFAEICKKQYSIDDVPRALNHLSSLRSDSGTYAGYNNLLNYKDSYFAVGVGQKTLNLMDISIPKDSTFSSSKPYDILIWNVKYGDGDGTVPYYSATISHKAKELAASGRYAEFRATHGGLIGTEEYGGRECLQWIVSTLKGVYSSKVSSGKVSYIVIRTACPVDVTITRNGESLSSKSDDMTSSASFGRMDIIGSDDIKMFCIDEGSDYNISMQGTGVGRMDYDIRFFDKDDRLKDERKFEGVHITDKTKITTGTAKAEPTTLKIDTDGDGTPDTTYRANPNEIVTISESGEPSYRPNPAVSQDIGGGTGTPGSGGSSGGSTPAPVIDPLPTEAGDDVAAPDGTISTNPSDWMLTKGTPDADGNIPVTLETKLSLDKEITALGVDTGGFVGSVKAEVLLNGAPVPTAPISGKASRGANISYTLRLTGKVKSNDDSSAVTGIRYRVAGEDQIYSVTLPAGGIALKNMSAVTPTPTPTPTPSKPAAKSSGGGCDAGLGAVALFAAAAVIKRRGMK